ncbi:MAG: acyl-CoA thioesterase [Thermaurantiacus sp.]
MADKEQPRGRGHYRAWRPIATRWMDNDVYGHVNNVVFYSWFDTAVNAWLVEQGLLDIEKGAVIGLVVTTACTYFRPVAFPEEVQAGIAVSRIGGSSVRYDIGLFTRSGHAPAAQGHFVHVYVDRETRKPIALPDAWRQSLSPLVNEAFSSPAGGTR